jgi:hypothetical protein
MICPLSHGAAACVLALVLHAFAVNSAHAIVTSDEPGSHVVGPGEVAFGLNLDGVGYLSWSAEGSVDLPGGSGFLIGDRDVLTAAHLIVDELGNDRFFAAGQFGYEPRVVFDTPAGRLSLAVVEDQTRYFSDYFVTFRDLAVVRLAEDAPDSIPRYPIYAAGHELGRPIVVAGYGRAGFGAVGMDGLVAPDGPEDIIRRAGMNRFEALGESLDLFIFPIGRLPPDIVLVSDFDSGEEAQNGLASMGIASDLGFGADEVGVALGDSGGPAFIGSAVAGVTVGNLPLVTSDITPFTDGSWGEASIYTRLSGYRDFLTAATEGRAVFVPEPSAVALLLTSVAALAGGRRLSLLNHPAEALHLPLAWPAHGRVIPCKLAAPRTSVPAPAAATPAYTARATANPQQPHFTGLLRLRRS